MPGSIGKTERQDKIDTVNLIIWHPGTTAFQHAVPSRAESLFRRSRKCNLSIQFTIA
ncbi:Uncharacterised protein [Klebsiella pneumoniae]|nr:Uncharacterised protein [Klebsiella pneumoniae]